MAQEFATEKDFYNLPAGDFERRGDVYSDIIAAYNSDHRKLRILEIGVFRANLIKGVMQRIPEMVESYTGVDPYIGNESDPYFDSYWKGDESVAHRTYVQSKKIFGQLGGTLLRDMSNSFFANNKREFDVIVIDGDHRYKQVVRDLENGLKVLAPHGLLVCDDYGNSDTPQVRKAIDAFWGHNPDFYDKAGYRPLWFQNEGKHVPIQLSVVYWKKK